MSTTYTDRRVKELQEILKELNSTFCVTTLAKRGQTPKQIIGQIDEDPKCYLSIFWNVSDLKSSLVRIKQHLEELPDLIRVILQSSSIPPILLADLEAAFRTVNQLLKHLRERTKGTFGSKPYYGSSALMTICNDIGKLLQNVQVEQNTIKFKGSGEVALISEHKQTLSENFSKDQSRGFMPATTTVMVSKYCSGCGSPGSGSFCSHCGHVI